MKFREWLNEGMMSLLGTGESFSPNGKASLKASDRNKINRKFKDNYFNSMHQLSNYVMKAFEGTDVYPVVGYEKWGGAFTGSPNKEVGEKLVVDLAQGDKEIKNARLILNIYKMPSGKYELNAYIS